MEWQKTDVYIVTVDHAGNVEKVKMDRQDVLGCVRHMLEDAFETAANNPSIIKDLMEKHNAKVRE